ncbi:MAG TPA: hypothetical protein VF921_14380, partial [Vicinamibacterales bacterium]
MSNPFFDYPDGRDSTTEARQFRRDLLMPGQAEHPLDAHVAQSGRQDVRAARHSRVSLHHAAQLAHRDGERL